MKWSQSHIFTLRDDPADADIPSQALMVRAGLIKKLAPGIYTYGFLGLRAIRKFEKIIREELDKRSCVEVLMPMVQPKALWQETNRWEEMGDGLLKFKNRNDHEFCLGATHEEVITDYVRHDINSYRDMPTNLYQIQTKYRDEIRPRFGLMRGREFVMKDAYSFDVDEESAGKSYEIMHEAYSAIFDRLGLKYVVVQADSGNIGGNRSNEFQVLAENGEDSLMVCEEAGFAANVEVAPVALPEADQGEGGAGANQEPLEKFATPGLRSIDDLSKETGVPAGQLVKTMFFNASEEPGEFKPVCILLRGSDEVNPVKLKNLLGLANPPELLSDEEVRKTTGASPGSCGPVGLKIPIYMDQFVELLANYITGANEDDFHMKNVNHSRDFSVEGVADLILAKEGDLCPEGSGGVYKAFRGIEVGHIFYLGTKYSKSMKASFLDKNGKAQPIEMGCYGIGVTRTVQAAIEQCHDEDGIQWPQSIAPFHVHICHLDPKNEAVDGVAQKLYSDLWSAGIEVLMDDRNERPGVKFKDADLIGLPLRITLGKKGVEKGELELVSRSDKNKWSVSIEKAVDEISAFLSKES